MMTRLEGSMTARRPASTPELRTEKPINNENNHDEVLFNPPADILNAIHIANKPLSAQVTILTQMVYDMQQMMNAMYAKIDSLTTTANHVNIPPYSFSNEFPALPPPELNSHIHTTTLLNDTTSIPGQTTAPPNPAYELANRCVGFFPISKTDVDKNRVNINPHNTPEQHFQ